MCSSPCIDKIYKTIYGEKLLFNNCVNYLREYKCRVMGLNCFCFFLSQRIVTVHDPQRDLSKVTFVNEKNKFFFSKTNTKINFFFGDRSSNKF